MDFGTLTSVVGVGIDLIEHDRIQAVVLRYGDMFLNRVFTPHEQSYCDQKSNPYSGYALRFCAKEAFVKALGWGISDVCSWLDLEVRHDAKGKPLMVWSDRVQQQLVWQDVICHLSLTDTRLYAQAMVVLSAVPMKPKCGDLL